MNERYGSPQNPLLGFGRKSSSCRREPTDSPRLSRTRADTFLSCKLPRRVHSARRPFGQGELQDGILVGALGDYCSLLIDRLPAGRERDLERQVRMEKCLAAEEAFPWVLTVNQAVQPE